MTNKTMTDGKTSQNKYLARWNGKTFDFFVLNPTFYKGKVMENVFSESFPVDEEEVYKEVNKND